MTIERLKNEMVQQKLDLFESHRTTLLASLRATAKRLYLETGKPVTTDAVRAAHPIPDDTDPRIMGGVFREKGWECVGHSLSKRPECHKSNQLRMYVWRGDYD